MTELDETALVIEAESRLWRRRLGPLAWAALEHLALAAHPDHHGWAAPLGVRDVAGGIGVTKDTAARAVTALRAAGLVSFEQLDGIDGRRRSGYRLHLPEGIQLRTCPPDQDGPLQLARSAHCPDTADKNSCPNNPDRALPASGPLVESAAQRRGKSQPRRRRAAPSPVGTMQPVQAATLAEAGVQTALFALSSPTPDGGWHHPVKAPDVSEPSDGAR